MEQALKKKNTALMTASVATMIDSFNKDNIRLLTEAGYHVDVAANFGDGNPSAERMTAYKEELEQAGMGWYQIPTPRSPLKMGQIFRACAMLRKLVNEKQYKIVHCHSPVGSVVARLACMGARRRGTKVVYTAHGFHFFRGASKIAWLIYYPIEWFCSMFTDVLITINQEDYQRGKKLLAKRVEYVPGVGVDVERFRTPQGDPAALRSSFGFTPEDYVLISVGELSVRKNHEAAIRALAKAGNPRLKYLIVGNGDLEGYLKELVAELKLQEQVIFAGYRNDIRDLLHVADGFVFPSLQEGLPVALMEAMSAGLPVVCSSIRGNVDLIENGVGGWIYDPRDVDGFAEGIGNLLTAGREFGEQNVQTVRRFDIGTVREQMRQLYDSLN